MNGNDGHPRSILIEEEAVGDELGTFASTNSASLCIAGSSSSSLPARMEEV